ncbi:hypothetical protein H6P81_001165 [Aristolochia fimbriata]|uniref:Disease resistance R13L4/SHOC-2-like LRR domain-containing protein n=1 Tax=Aristolochia fimbriata TaxID=158543 RepID=A0AAV7F9E8_ARIFI|nr:hypothetical protein H6P81_001165 [Aristolochia fimbriata]
MGTPQQSLEEVVGEIMRIHRSLPPRPSLDEVEAATILVRNLDKEEETRIDSISRQRKDADVPDELFTILQEMQKNLVLFQSKDQKREAIKLLDLENIHALFDEFVQRASRCLPGADRSSSVNYSNGSTPSVSTNHTTTSTVTSSVTSSVGTGFNSLSTVSSGFHPQKDISRSSELFSKDDSYVKKGKTSLFTDGIGSGSDALTRGQFLTPSIASAPKSGENSEKLSLIKLASLIEVSAKKGARDLSLQNKLMDQIEWLPDSIGKLTKLVSLDLSENRILALPKTIGNLSSLTKLDLHSNRIAELPDSIGNLFSLVCLDLRSNQLTSLPPSLGKLSCLEELDLSSNNLSTISEAVGNLGKLKKLNIETNDIEELPHTIGNCSALTQLRADYNRLKALPEAVGRLEKLEVLSVRYNNIKSLPTTMASMSSLKELDVSFNELESIPEGLCLATTLVKMNLGNNFADLQSLPRSIGNLEMLEELDISNNQIRVLPDSFGMLSKLRVLRVEENPLEVPPRHIAEMGAQAVVQYMADLVSKKDVKAQPLNLGKLPVRNPTHGTEKPEDGRMMKFEH